MFSKSPNEQPNTLNNLSRFMGNGHLGIPIDLKSLLHIARTKLINLLCQLNDFGLKVVLEF
jgi:hypothetical protein